MTRALGMSTFICIILLATGGIAAARSYCNITDIEVKELSNGVQISVKADGRLEFDRWGRSDSGTLVRYQFGNARLQLDETFHQIDRMPVSYVQFQVAPGADQGIGVVMSVKLTERANVEDSTSPDMQTFIVTAMTAHTLGGGRGEGPAPRQEDTEEGKVFVESRDGLLTLRCVSADIHEVVAKIAHEGHVNVAVNDHVKHKISVNVADAPPEVILRGLAAGYGLALSEVDGVQMISEGVLKEKDLATYNRCGTASFPITYLKADDARSLLPTFLVSYLHFNSEQNAVVVTAPTQMLEKIEADLKAVDVPPPVLMVDAKIVEISDARDLERELKIDYKGSEVLTGMDTTTGVVGYTERAEPKAVSGVADTPQLEGALRALLSEGSAHIRANPRMAAVNGNRAEIFIGAQKFIRVTYIQSGQEQERIQGVPVGVRLRVTPWTGGNGEVTSTIQVEVSNIRSIDPETGLPLLSTRKANSTVRTRDGETIIIGGLRQQQTETTRSKIPILGDIPIIGGLFRSSSTSSTDTELMVFITPTVLNGDGRQSDGAEVQTRSTFLREGDPGYEPPGGDAQ